MENRRFTNTALPVFSGAECWYQHLHIVQAIVKSNGWSEETAALQLFAHLKGEALNVALLLDKGEAGVMDGTDVWTVGVLPISWQTGGSEKAVREHVSPTGTGPGYVCH